MKLPRAGADGLPKDGFDWITLKVIFQGSKGPKNIQFGWFATFCQFSQEQCDNFFYVLHTASWGWYRSTVKRWISLNYSKVIFKVGKIRFSPFSHNYWYYSVVTKCCPNLLHHVASLLWNQSCLKIWKVWNQFKGHFQGPKCPIWTFVIYIS